MNLKEKEKRLKIVRRILYFWTLFIGIGAIGGSTCMLIEPSGKLMGMEALIPYFQVLPFADVLFQNYTFPGISLLIVNGLSNIIAFIFLFRKQKVGYYLGCLFGFTLMLWIIIQFVIFPANFLSTIYFIFGLLQFITGICSIIFYKQTEFSLKVKDYNHNCDTLTVFFSRMGYTAQIAYDLAYEAKATIEEIKTNELTMNTKGFWWCGRFGMHRWPMKTLDLVNDLNNYEKIIIVSPIWVFRMASPIRDFISKNQEVLNKKDIRAL